MIEVSTQSWDIDLWWIIIEWCSETFGPCQWGVSWFWHDDYSLYFTEETLVWFKLRFA